jgi:hypothetical protein
MNFAVFSGIFPEIRISAQKQDTKAILLKTALVRVSCIQNTQISGKTTTKRVRESRYVLDVSDDRDRPRASSARKTGRGPSQVGLAE